MARRAIPFALPDGTRGIMCVSVRATRCVHCGARATLQCDFPAAPGRTCDAHLCRRCAVPVGRDRDYCPSHMLPEAA